MFMMKTILFIVPVFLSFTIFFLFGCGTSKENSLALQMQADSVIVEVSTKLKSGSILFAKGKCIRISTNGVETEPDRVPLVAKERKRLEQLAVRLFSLASKESIALSQSKFSGRTGYPTFYVTVCHDGQTSTMRYEMGEENNGVTQGTYWAIRYSESFRDFMFSVFRILGF